MRDRGKYGFGIGNKKVEQGDQHETPKNHGRGANKKISHSLIKTIRLKLMLHVSETTRGWIRFKKINVSHFMSKQFGKNDVANFVDGGSKPGRQQNAFPTDRLGILLIGPDL